METVIDRNMHTYGLLVNRTAAASLEARAKVTDYVATLCEAGEKDTHRLTVCGLTYLRELDGSNHPVKAGFRGLGVRLEPPPRLTTLCDRPRACGRRPNADWRR